MERKWVVLFEGEKPGPADDFSLDFVDIIEVLGEIPVYKRMVFDRLVRNIKMHENYKHFENIKDITPPEKVPFSLQSYFILLGIDDEGLKYGLLMILLEDRVVLGGIWPEALAEAIKSDPKILDGLIYAFMERPSNWKEVIIVYA